MYVTACHALQLAQPRLFVGRDRQRDHHLVFCVPFARAASQTWLCLMFVPLFVPASNLITQPLRIYLQQFEAHTPLFDSSVTLFQYRNLRC